MTPEGRLKLDIKKRLDDVYVPLGLWYFMPVQTGYGKHGIPDFICAWKSFFFTVETKREEGEPTDLQNDTMTKIARAGGKPMVIKPSTVEHLWVYLEQLHRL